MIFSQSPSLPLLMTRAPRLPKKSHPLPPPYFTTREWYKTLERDLNISLSLGVTFSGTCLSARDRAINYPIICQKINIYYFSRANLSLWLNSNREKNLWWIPCIFLLGLFWTLGFYIFLAVYTFSPPLFSLMSWSSLQSEGHRAFSFPFSQKKKRFSDFDGALYIFFKKGPPHGFPGGL